MALVILWAIAMIGILIWFCIAAVSQKESVRKNVKNKIHVGTRVKLQRTCPRCGSPVIEYSDGWECGWCGDYCRY